MNGTVCAYMCVYIRVWFQFSREGGEGKVKGSRREHGIGGVGGPPVFFVQFN